jgi:hypothetical protein
VTHRVTKPGGYQLRAAVRDTISEKVGSASQFVEVPDMHAGRLALSGIMMDSRSIKDAPELEAHEDPTGGPAVRVFKPGESISYVFDLYNAVSLAGEIRASTEIQARVFREGRLVWTGEPYPFDPTAGQKRGGSVARDLHFGPGTPAGQYMLQVIARTRAAKKVTAVAVQWIDFELRSTRETIGP